MARSILCRLVQPPQLVVPCVVAQITVEQPEHPALIQRNGTGHGLREQTEETVGTGIVPVVIAWHREPARKHLEMRLMAFQKPLAGCHRISEVANLDQPRTLPIRLGAQGGRHLGRTTGIAIAGIANDKQRHGFRRHGQPAEQPYQGET